MLDSICVQNFHYLTVALEKISLFLELIYMMSSSVHIDNKEKDILIFDERPKQGLDDITLTAEAKYPINFTQLRKRFVLSLLSQFKAKDSKKEDYALWLGNILKDFTINNMKKN